MIHAAIGKVAYTPSAYPLLRKQFRNFDSRLIANEDMVRYGLMHEVADLLSKQDSNNHLFQESKNLLMQMWHDDYPLLAEQSLETFISEGVVIDKLRLPETTLWQHSTTANSSINMREDHEKNSFIKVDMRDKKSMDDFLDTERPKVFNRVWLWLWLGLLRNLNELGNF